MKPLDYLIAFVVVCFFIASICLFMGGYWIWAIVVGLPSLFLLSAFLTELTSTNTNRKSNSSNNDYYTSGYGNLWLSSRKGFTKFEMVGMYYRGLKRSDTGEFNGYAKAETNNSHDRYTVAIYNSSDKHIGYLPSGNKNIHTLLLENGGSLPAYGYISCDSNLNNITGEVAIMTNTTLDINNLFYDKRVFIAGKFNVSQKDLSVKLRDMGAYISKTLHDNVDIVLVGKNIKNMEILDRLESLRKNESNIKLISNNELENILNN